MLRLHADLSAPVYMLDTPGGFCSAFPFAALAKVPSIKHIRIFWTKIFRIINLGDNKQALAALVSLENESQPPETKLFQSFAEGFQQKEKLNLDFAI